MRIVRWIGRAGAVVVGLMVPAIGGVYAQSQWTLTREGTPPDCRANSSSLPCARAGARTAR